MTIVKRAALALSAASGLLVGIWAYVVPLGLSVVLGVVLLLPDRRRTTAGTRMATSAVDR